ncbi:DELLA protein RGL1-like [Hibiscus syriacus]|uniref:DELLA protein RGL1-like n=1 Tax=Hibiscus syriacus TaxID=106335 RepID=UPI0019237741|nr:DELLA protein RGL1-like [Hibiscus syriacus]
MDVKRADELIMAGSTGESSAASLSNSHDRASTSCFNLTGNDIKDIELVILLLASANEISNQRLDRASKFLNLCDFLSSNVGTTIQRVVHYFSKALRDKIEREDRVTLSKTGDNKLSHPDETMSHSLPVQAIIENVASSKKVHFIDMAIRSGARCISLMQALATRDEPRIELLKTTAIWTTLQTKIEET